MKNNNLDFMDQSILVAQGLAIILFVVYLYYSLDFIENTFIDESFEFPSIIFIFTICLAILIIISAICLLILGYPLALSILFVAMLIVAIFRLIKTFGGFCWKVLHN